MPRMDMPEGANIAVPGEYSLVTSSLSNKGNPTSQGFDNLMVVEAKQPIRIIDTKGNILFEGTGPEAARQAVAIGQNLSDTLGNKAGWDIQTVPVGTSNFKTIANEKVNKSDLEQIGSVIGTALPIAVSLIPGLQFAGPILSSVLAGGAGAAMAGRDPLKGAVMGGLSAAGGELLGPVIQGAGVGARAATAIGTGLGSTAGGLATGQSLQNSLLGGVASGGLSYLGGDLRGALKGSPPSGGDTGALPGDIVVSGYGTPSIAAPADFTAKKAPENVADGKEIVLTANRANLPFIAPTTNLFNNAQYSGGENVRDVAPEPKTDDTDPEKDILVTANPTPSIGLPSGALETGNTGTPPPADLLDQITDPEVKKQFEEARDAGTLSLSDIASYLRLAGLGTGLLGSLLGGSGSGTSGVRYSGAGTGTLNPMYTAKLPAPTLPGAAGNFAVRPQSDFGVVNGQPRDWTQYGFGPEASFFNYVPQPGEARVAAPITAPTANQPSAPAMYVPDDMRFNEGGSFAAKHGGMKARTQFAVSGPGDGRSDDIPAMLSDGEYVMDAETVALLGNGSPKAGAEALDRLRVNLRKHKGQKLAKGEFSVNAKRPERYLVGGRI